MNSRQLRLFVAMLSGGLLAWLAVRRRQELLQALPTGVQNSIQERIVLPVTAFEATPDDSAGEHLAGALTRKVGRNRRISVHGKLYGPLEGDVIGRQVEVVETDGSMIVSLDGEQIGSFTVDG